MIKQHVLTTNDGAVTVCPHAGSKDGQEVPFKYFTIQRYESAYIHLDSEYLDDLIELLIELKKETQL